MQAVEASTSTQQQSASGSEKTSSSGDQHEGGNTYVNESEDDARKVPEMGFGGGQTVNSVSVKIENNNISNHQQQQGGSSGGQRKRGRTPADREHKRLRRLLRNRVSAQHARERKKAYVTDLETKTKELENRNSELEERVSTLQNENFMLRQILKNTTAKSKGSGLTEASSRLEHGV